MKRLLVASEVKPYCVDSYDRIISVAKCPPNRENFSFDGPFCEY